MAKRSGVTVPAGFSAGGYHCGIKKDGKPDLGMIVSDRPAVAWAVFTDNRVKGAPVLLSQKHLRSAVVNGVVINSGNSNVMTLNGMRDAERMADGMASNFGWKRNQILVASTGVIGEPLPIEKIESGINTLAPALKATGGLDLAEAITTTDLAIKEKAVRIQLGDKKVAVGGAAKGSGMIHPSMATMLAFVTTDATVTKPVLKELVKRSCDQSFNRISVDGDTSTSDMFMVMANGASGAPMIDKPSGKLYSALLDAVTSVSTDLAKKIVKDGEGATKFVTVRVTGARSVKDADLTAMSIARSNLVKTALFGQDANWGRIVMAAGNSGARFDPEKLSLKICKAPVFTNGALVTAGWESRVAPRLKFKDILIELDLGAGPASSEVWTCDLSYDYIRINADYRS